MWRRMVMGNTPNCCSIIDWCCWFRCLVVVGPGTQPCVQEEKTGN